jgi:hypothetical protein
MSIHMSDQTSTDHLPLMDFVEAVADYVYRRFVEELHSLDTGEAFSTRTLPSVTWSINVIEDCDCAALMLAQAFRNPGSISSSAMLVMF